MSSKTLVVILAQTRAHELTFDSFKKNVIDELKADLCVCIGVKNDYDYDNPYYKLAKYRFLYNEENDPTFSKSIPYSYEKTIEKYRNLQHFKMNNEVMYEKYDNVNSLFGKTSDPRHSCENIKHLGEFTNEDDIDLSLFPENDAFIYHKNNLCGDFSHQLYSIKQNDNNITSDNRTITYLKHKHYMEFLQLKSRINLEIHDTTRFTGYTISIYIYTFFLWFLQQNIEENDLLSKYDRIVIVRSDYIYSLPFPKMELLPEENIWIPNGEDYNGVCDKSVVLSKSNFNTYVSILENFYIKSNIYYTIIERNSYWNLEAILKIHLHEVNGYNLIKRYPNVSYSVRGITDVTRWSTGVYYYDLGYFIKYPSEYESVKREKNEYENSNLSIDDFYKSKIHI